jgi:hypothetical protein
MRMQHHQSRPWIEMQRMDPVKPLAGYFKRNIAQALGHLWQDLLKVTTRETRGVTPLQGGLFQWFIYNNIKLRRLPMEGHSEKFIGGIELEGNTLQIRRGDVFLEQPGMQDRTYRARAVLQAGCPDPQL